MKKDTKKREKEHIKLPWQGGMYLISELAKMSGFLKPAQIHNRLNCGWSIERIMITPIDQVMSKRRSIAFGMEKRFYPSRYNPDVIIDLWL